jgi:hypothetical protein
MERVWERGRGKGVRGIRERRGCGRGVGERGADGKKSGGRIN